MNSTFSCFIATKVFDQPVSSPAAVSDSSGPTRVILPFKDQSSADIVRRQLQRLSQMYLQCLSAKRLSAILKCKKPSHLLSTSNVLCTNLNVTCAMQVMLHGYTSRHLHQRIEEHKSASSSIGQHFRVKHSSAPEGFGINFSILGKCKTKIDGLVLEMFFINELRPSLNVQSDSLRAKVFK